MQIERLFQIVYMLLEQKTVTAKTLAERFKVSTRTIYRDMEILSQCGIPVYTTRGKGGGISLLEGFVLNKSTMTETEQNQILMALESLPIGGKEQIRKTIEKYRSFFQKSRETWIQVDFSQWGTEKAVFFEILKEVILEKKVISFLYYNSKGEVSQRQAEPYQLWFKGRDWYVKAYCREKKALRIFKISRIKQLEVLEETFETAWLEQEKAVEYPMPEQVTVVCRIKKEAAYRVYDEFALEQITQEESGDFLVQMTYVEDTWLYGYLLSWGGDAVVLKPDFVRKRLMEKLREMMEEYVCGKEEIHEVF